MNRILRTAVLAVAALTCTTLAAAPAVAGPAVAAPSERGVDAVKKAVTTRIDKRLDALKKFGTTLAEAKQVQPAHRETLTELLEQQTTGLTELRTKVQSETTREALKTDARSMVTDYRVFLLTGPKIRLTAAIDTELAAAEKLKAAAVTESLTGKVDTLLAIQPGADADAIRAAVKPVRTAAKEARTALKAQRK
jgi:hypothetical protein